MRIEATRLGPGRFRILLPRAIRPPLLFRLGRLLVCLAFGVVLLCLSPALVPLWILVRTGRAFLAGLRQHAESKGETSHEVE